jgi:alkylation response protein AidB-like acyl-CoA dehydrogenase
MAKSTEAVTIPIEPGWDEIREGVRRICEQYPNAYWMKLDHESAYPFEFVNALTEAGYLGALIPEEYGGAGLPISAGCAILETIHESGCNAGACHAQMYTMGTVLRHCSEARRKSICRRSRRASCASRPSVSPSPRPAPILPRSAPPR